MYPPLSPNQRSGQTRDSDSRNEEGSGERSWPVEEEEGEVLSRLHSGSPTFPVPVSRSEGEDVRDVSEISVTFETKKYGEDRRLRRSRGTTSGPYNTNPATRQQGGFGVVRTVTGTLDCGSSEPRLDSFNRHQDSVKVLTFLSDLRNHSLKDRSDGVKEEKDKKYRKFFF